MINSNPRPINIKFFLPAILAGIAILFTACGPSSSDTSSTNGTTNTSDAKKITICLIPKKKGLPYFTSCAAGAQAAANDLGNIELIYDGPTDGSPEKQASMIEQYTLKGVDVIAVSPNDPNVVAPAMRKARTKGIHVIAWDADGIQDARDFFVNQATAEAIAHGMVDTMVNDLGGPDIKAEVAIVTAYLTAANQNVWIEHMKSHISQKYTNLNLVAIKPSDEDQKLAFKVTQDLMKAYPDIKGFFGISSVSFPGAAEAVKQAGKLGQVMVTGLATPNSMKSYVKDDTVKSVVLWNTAELGYLTVKVGEALANGRLNQGDTSFDAGKLGEKKIVGDQVLLGDILVFNKNNIDQYDF
ncbi:MAG: substrate-binding domain-containing protein [Verrucomicrobia bacterium]|jgi:rhamnose transport system substrate-binding protein|nr:substrate-binding domain-containing protein [Verrucomicrobiota bacterium]